MLNLPSEALNYAKMKKIILAAAALLAAITTTNAQNVYEGTDSLVLTVENSKFMNELARKGDAHDVIYIGEFFDAETIAGFSIGALGGYTADGWEAGVLFGYSGLKWQTNATLLYGQGKFDDRSYTAPSAFVDVKVALARWGKNKTWSLNLGGQVGYKHAEKKSKFFAEQDGVEVSGEVEGYGSGLAYGPLVSLEKRTYHNGMRYFVEGGYVWHDMKYDGATHTRGLWEVRIGIKFTFHKHMRNFK